MGINFSNLSIPKSSKQITDPIELFQSLKVNYSSINDLWLAQGDALREWHSKRTNDDTAIVLNTGAGKTLVGLLLPPSPSANPDFETVVIELSEFKAIAERLRAALKDICTKALPVTLPQAIFEIFKERNLLWCDLYEQIDKSKLWNLSQSK